MVLLRSYKQVPLLLYDAFGVLCVLFGYRYARLVQALASRDGQKVRDVGRGLVSIKARYMPVRIRLLLMRVIYEMSHTHTHTHTHTRTHTQTYTHMHTQVYVSVCVSHAGYED